MSFADAEPPYLKTFRSYSSSPPEEEDLGGGYRKKYGAVGEVSQDL